MTQTLALLLDSYRELNAKRLFWVVLGLTVLVVVLFATVGMTGPAAGSAITVLGYATPIRLPLMSLEQVYKVMFVKFGVGFWLSWLAAILALVSTAGIFPDLMSGGSIDLYLSKPIGRARLFFTKVVGGLLFVTLQVGVFCTCCVAVFRVRTGVWLPGLFAAVPLVVLMFSYLFAICVLLGVLTRSTITALLLTLLAWAIVWAVQTADTVFLYSVLDDQHRAARLDRQIPALQAELAAMDARHPPTTADLTESPPPAAGPSIFHPLGGGPGGRQRARWQVQGTLDRLQSERAELNPDRFAIWHTALTVAVAPLPKTTGTIEVLERQLVKLADLPPPPSQADEDAGILNNGGDEDASAGPPGRRGRRDPANRANNQEAARDVDAQLRGRSAGYVLGTSCAFEAVVLALACWLFSRRDY